MSPSKQALLLALAVVICTAQSFSQDAKIGDVSDGNRSSPVHLLNLYDEEGSIITPQIEPMLPFSPKQTCSPCHDYTRISDGWHFNAATGVLAGRRGQPWIFVDRTTATQVPLSYRAWYGTYRPEELGITPMRFVQLFGRHMPGGGVGDNEQMQTPENVMRWWVSGKLEVNCLSCHDAEPGHDQAEFDTQTRKGNFRWAAGATSGFAAVQGSARDMPDNFSIYGSLLDDGKKIPPAIRYDRNRFDSHAKVLFNLERQVANDRCYFCHSTKVIGAQSKRWQSDEDIHISAGMQCVDCHRNGLDHRMVRGYEGEAQEYDNPGAATLTCKGCHLGEDSEEGVRAAGRLGAPVPDHVGIPPVHFQKLTCTTCHSGPWPAERAYPVKTSRAHALGTHRVNRGDAALPHIVAPVFVEQGDGVIAPHKMFWPSFWAKIERGQVKPIDPLLVQPLAAELVPADTLGTGDWPGLTQGQIATILQGLVQGDSTLTAAYVGGGNLYRLSATGRMIAEEHAAATPYSWAFAHDVRPTAQSLGVRGCDDCHAGDSPFYFAQIPVDTPVAAESGAVRRMVDFQDISSFYARLFGWSFMLRPLLKIIILAAGGVLALIFVSYLFNAFSAFIRGADGS